MASFEGQPLCLSHPANGDFVTPENIQSLSFGHVQNIRKGDKVLDSGDWPLLGDIIITREPLLSQIKNGARPDLSAGYRYTLAKDEDSGVLLQTEIIGNHIACVPSGRAGSARIVDSAPQQVPQDSAPPDSSAVSGDSKGRAGAEARTNDASHDPAREIPNAPQSKPGAVPPVTQQKEHKPMSLAKLFGLGLKAAAQDAETKPEDLAAMASEFAANDKKADDKTGDKKTAKDAEVEKPVEKVEDRRADDRRTDDHRTDDRRKTMHDALDRMYDEYCSRQGGNAEHQAEDVDLDELKNLVSQFFEEEKGEGEHQDSEVAPITEGEPAEEDGAPPLPPEEEAETLAADRTARAADRFLDDSQRARTSDAREILETLKAGIARTGDRDLIRRFNGLASRFTRSSRTSPGAYSAFARSAAAVRTGDAGPDRYGNRNKFAPAAANRMMSAEEQQTLQAAYNSRRSTNTTMEVKK